MLVEDHFVVSQEYRLGEGVVPMKIVPPYLELFAYFCISLKAEQWKGWRPGGLIIEDLTAGFGVFGRRGNPAICN